MHGHTVHPALNLFATGSITKEQISAGGFDMTSGHGRRDDSTRYPLALAIVGAVLLGPGPVFAEGIVLEEIIVTAQKRGSSEKYVGSFRHG